MQVNCEWHMQFQHMSSHNWLYLSTSPGRKGSRCCSSKPNNREPPSIHWLFIRATCSSSIKSYLLLSEFHILRVQQLKTKRTSFHSEVWHEQLQRTPCPRRVKASFQMCPFLIWSELNSSISMSISLTEQLMSSMLGWLHPNSTPHFAHYVNQG